jgi:hypothetical protein
VYSLSILISNAKAHLLPTGWAQTLENHQTLIGHKTFEKPLHYWRSGAALG